MILIIILYVLVAPTSHITTNTTNTLGMTAQQLQLKLQKQAQLKHCLNQSASVVATGSTAMTPAGGGSAVAAALQGKIRRRSATEK